MLLGAVACGEGASPVGDSTTERFAGTYTYRAEGAVHCARNPQAQCICSEPGYHEGVLVLNEGESLTGELRTSTCMPGQACTAVQTHPIVRGFRIGMDSAFLQMNTTQTIRPTYGQTHWARLLAGNLSGRYTRSDGSTNGCGDDQGPFTAIRQQ